MQKGKDQLGRQSQEAWLSSQAFKSIISEKLEFLSLDEIQKPSAVLHSGLVVFFFLPLVL